MRLKKFSIENKKTNIHHNGNEMSVVIRKWTITPKDEMLGP